VSDGGFPGFGMGITVADFQAGGGGGGSKHRNMVKKLGEVDESFVGDISKHSKLRYRLFQGKIWFWETELDVAVHMGSYEFQGSDGIVL